MDTEEVRLEAPDGFQVVLGQSHFIKTVEDIYEALVTSAPGIKFGVAFCEASGKALIRFDGSDEESTRLARSFASKVGAGHSFVVVLNGTFPINVLDRLKRVDEVVTIFCATANPVTVLVARSQGGRGVIGVIDGVSPKGEETDKDRAERKEFLRKIRYKR